jgi:hypothetical protein
MPLRISILLAFTLSVSGLACGESHATEGPDLDPDTRFVDLSPEQRRIWCMWKADWIVQQYEVETVPGPICPDGSGFVFATEACMDSLGGFDRSCSRTVGAETQCVFDQLDGVCPATNPIPEEGSPCRWPDDCGIPYPDD